MSEAVYKRSDEAIFSEIGGDVVALHVRRGQCYGMEAVTAAVWGLLAEPADLSTICAQLAERYEVDADTCRVEVSRLLDQLQEEGLIEQAAA